MPGASLLIVDDNPATLKLLRLLLTTENCDVRTAATSKEALVVIESFRPRLVLIDIQLPGMDGLEFTRRLKSNPATRDIIVLAITAYTMAGDEERVYLAGCSGYITKPVNTRTLPAVVKLHLEPRRAVKPALEVSDYRDDMLAELRTNFLVEGEEQARELLGRLQSQFNADRTQRIAHRWAGIAATLGFVEIAERAHHIEATLTSPAEESIEAAAMIPAGEYVSRLRSQLLRILQMFADTIQGKRETPSLPPAVRDVLSEKLFAVIGFERTEAARISGALADARSLSHVFQEIPDAGSLQCFHAAVLNISESRQTRIFPQIAKPVLFVGSAEALLRRESGIPEHSCDFLLGPWDDDELVFRAYRLFSPCA